MRKISGLIFILVLLINISVKESLAATFNLTPDTPIDVSSYANKKITLIITGQNLFISNKSYTLYQDPPDGGGPGKSLLNGQSSGNDVNSRLFEWNLDNSYQKLGKWQYEVCSGGRSPNTCVFSGSYEIVMAAVGNPTMTAKQKIYQVGKSAEFIIHNTEDGQVYSFWWDGDLTVAFTHFGSSTIDFTVSAPIVNSPTVDKKFCMTKANQGSTVGLTCFPSDTVTFQLAPPPSGGGTAISTCDVVPGSGKNDGVPTALGCVATKPEDFVAQLLGWVIGIGGGIAFLLIVWGGFQVVTSSGDPEKLNSGKEIIVSALTGLLMIVFSVILLRIIGVDILKIPGF